MITDVQIATGLAAVALIGGILVGRGFAATEPPWLATYTPHGWIATAGSSADISAKANDLKANQFNVQIHNIGAFTAAGSISASEYAGLDEWISASRATDPDQEIVAWLNGSESSHVNVTSTHATIAAWIADFVSTTGVDGVWLDFEPFSQDNPNLVALLTAIRAGSPSTWIAVNAPGYADQWSQPFMGEIASLVNAVSPMLYDTSLTSKRAYTAHVTSTIAAYKQGLGTVTKLYPSIPAYNDNEWHSRTVENIASASNGIRAAGGTEGAAVYWWYEMNDTDKAQWSAAIAKNTFQAVL